MKQQFFTTMLLVMTVSVLMRIGLRHKQIRDVADCNANLRNIATAVEMYSTDNSGRYPDRLEPLVPLYLVSIPKCPASGHDSYSATYQKTVSPDTFTIDCQAQHPSVPGGPTVNPIYNPPSLF